MAEQITADYLVVGAGAMGLAFADTIISDTNKTVAIIERRARPGGHWTTAYPFVRLHQPSSFYGVNSRPLGSGKLDEVGWNKGLCELAPRDEVMAYFDLLMRQTFLPSGRVHYFPKHEYLGNGEFQSILSKKIYKVCENTCIVDATYSKTQVPSMRPPPYEVASGVDIVAVNNLPDISRPYANYTVVGAGKTGMDACLWMLETGIKPSEITWIIPRNGFLLPRDTFQPGPEFAARRGAHIAAQRETIMSATSINDMLQKQLDTGVLYRLDDNVWPTLYHCGTVSKIELDALKEIKNIVRKGRITKLTKSEVFLEKGTYKPVDDTLYIDCAANGLTKCPSVPVWSQNNKLITLQPLRHCQHVLSAAFIAHIEATYPSEDKNTLCKPVPMPDIPSDSARILLQTYWDLLKWASLPKTLQWLGTCRLDYFRVMNPAKTMEEAEMMRKAILAMSLKLKGLLEQEGEEVRKQLEGFDFEGFPM